jgi:methylated-DNA-[protein]-cysteine S-methyltransferase
MTTTLEMAVFATPAGSMTAAVRDGRVCALGFTDHWNRHRRVLAARFDGAVTMRKAADPAGIVSTLGRYFAGELDVLAEVEVDGGGTEFQRRVWDRLRDIPAGSTMSYAALARAVGHPRAVRAVGAANGANPIGIVVPCHRVVGADGTLTGYNGGVERKRWLLAHEAGGATLFRATTGSG